MNLPRLPVMRATDARRVIRWLGVVCALLLSACAMHTDSTPQAVQIWSFSYDEKTRLFTMGGSNDHPGRGSMACPITPDGYLLATLHGVKSGAALLQTEDGGDVYITQVYPSVSGYSLHPARKSEPWTPDVPSDPAVLRLVKSFKTRDLALLKVNVATPRFFALRNSPVPPGESVLPQGNPLNGERRFGPVDTVLVVGMPVTPWDMFILHPARTGDSGSPVVDRHGLVAGLLTKVFQMEDKLFLARFNGLPPAEIEAAIQADRLKQLRSRR